MPWVVATSQSENRVGISYGVSCISANTKILSSIYYYGDKNTRFVQRLAYIRVLVVSH